MSTRLTKKMIVSLAIVVVVLAATTSAWASGYFWPNQYSAVCDHFYTSIVTDGWARHYRASTFGGHKAYIGASTWNGASSTSCGGTNGYYAQVSGLLWWVDANNDPVGCAYMPASSNTGEAEANTLCDETAPNNMYLAESFHKVYDQGTPSPTKDSNVQIVPWP